MLELNHLYTLKLSPLQDVRLARAPAKDKSSSDSRAGLARFSVAAHGRYRITVDVPVWIDVVSPRGAIDPADFHGWHACGLFRKSLEYALDGEQTLVLQITGARVDEVKLVIRAL